MGILEQAIAFAKSAHGDQRRKYTDEPYWHHLRNVAEIVASIPHDENMLVAAWLHDVLEDTTTKTRELEDAFGPDVLKLVFDLTDFASNVGNRRLRKELDRMRLAASSSRAKTIKLADLIDNTSSIVERDKNFARVYLDEKALLLPCLKGGDERLWDRAYEILQAGQRELIQAKLGGM